MNIKEFNNLLFEKLNEKGICERTKDNANGNCFYYDTDYSSINMMYNAEVFDLRGHKVWIRIPCQIEGFKDFFIEFFLREYEGLDFRANPSAEANTIAIDIMLIECNNQQGWHNVAVHDFNSNSSKKVYSSDCRYIEYIQEAEWSKAIQYEPNDVLVNVLMENIKKAQEILSDASIFESGSFTHIQQENLSEGKRKVYKSELRKYFKEKFDKHFNIK